MDEFRAVTKQAITERIASMPARLAGCKAKLEEYRKGQASLAALQDSFKNSCVVIDGASNKVTINPNSVVEEKLNYVRDQLCAAVQDFLLAERFLKLHFPEAEEGSNNFYVAVQQELVKMLAESRKKLEGDLSGVDCYYGARADLVDKAASKLSKDVTTSSSESAYDAKKKDNGEDKTSTDNSTTKKTDVTEKVTTYPVCHERVQAVVAHDVKVDVTLTNQLEGLMTELAMHFDQLEKNFARLAAPREISEGGRMYY